MMKGKNKWWHAALTAALFFVLPGTYGQGGTSGYPKSYFRNPLSVPMSLTANFGELRPNHWHMGLDLRTDQKENYPVFAAADGYVVYAGVRPLSFGRFIIIRHSNGLSTLYAHLNKFYTELENYTLARQTEKESWAVELALPEEMFPVKKGDLIALSGNTGGSQGPHLHFEILDTKSGRSLNPQLFGFDIKDNVPPVINRLAIYDRSISTYMQIPQLVAVKKTDTGFFTKPSKILTGYKKLSFAIGAYDLVSGSSGANGIYGAVLYLDGRPQNTFIIDSMTYDESDYINAHIDRKYKNNGGPYLQHLSTLPGFRGRVYQEIEGNGIIELNDTGMHVISIDVFDTEENLSTLFFQIQYSDSLAAKNKKQVWSKQLIPVRINVVDEKNFEAYLPEDCLYDTVPLIYNRQNIFPRGAVTAQHRLGDPVYPVHSAMSIRLKPEIPVPDKLKDKIIMTREWQGKRSVRKATWQQDWLAARFDVFGIYQAFIDTQAPEILPPAKAKDTLDLSPLDKIVFTPADNFGIKSFRAELNGEWMMFTNDKARDFVYVFDKNFAYGIYELKVKAEDLAGNTTEKSWWFKKNPYTPPPKKKKMGSKKRVVSGKKKAAVKKK